MNDTELLEALDRRARRAVLALEDAMSDEPPVPELSTSDPRRQWAPLLVAAGLLVVAFLGAGVLLTDGDEDGTVAGEREVPVETGDGATGIGLDDPGAAGFQVRAAFPDAEPSDEFAELLAMTWTAHVPAAEPDDIDRAVLTGVTPIDEYTFTGRLVDIGGPEATVRDVGSMVMLVWRDGEQARQLMAARLTIDELVDIATTALAAGWTGEAPLPSHQVLHQGPSWDFFPILEFATVGPSGRDGIAYDHPEDELDFVIGWSSGDPVRWLARQAMSPETTIHDVAGREVAENTFGPRGTTELSWLEDDGTLVEIVTYGRADALLDLIGDRLVQIERSTHEALVRDHPAEEGTSLVDIPPLLGQPDDDQAPLAQLAMQGGGAAEYRVEIVAQAGGGLLVMTEVDDDSGVSASGHPLRDLRTSVLEQTVLVGADGSPTGPLLVSGTIPPGVDPRLITLVDRTTGRAVAADQTAVGAIPGSDHQLLLALVPGATSTTRLDVTLPVDGGAVTWRL